MFTQRILDDCETDRAKLARRLADAAARVDEATIVTIHGFAQRAAAENAFESALAFDRGDAVDDPSLYREAAADYWRRHVFGGAARAGDVLALWPSPDALYRTLAPLLARPHVQLAGIDRTRLAELQQKWPRPGRHRRTAGGRARRRAPSRRPAQERTALQGVGR